MRAGPLMIALAACGPSVAPDAAPHAPVIEIAPASDEAPDEVLVPELEEEPPTLAIPFEDGGCDAVMTLALQTAIDARSKSKLTAGMKPEGQVACKRVAEGGTLEQPLMLAPGRCYTILAASFPNVTEVDVELLIDAAGLPPSLKMGPLARDTETGPSATIGSGASCFRNPLPIASPTKIVVTARAGFGPVAVKVYAK